MTDIAAFPLPFRAGHKVAVTPIRTLRELEMMQLSAVIRAKPAWEVKMNDADVVAKWTREAAEQGTTEAQIRYVLPELAYYAERRDERTGIEVSGVDGVWQLDALIDDSARVDLRARRLQVIVKLAAIHLTHDKPAYRGGSWHVEGMMNERIVSTGIYYWDSGNVTDSRLSFRVAVGEPEYEQNDRKGVREVYGVGGEDAMNQVLGSAETRAGRALAFPNILQHRVAPFRLADPSRPGHRKILAFFLVDPSVAIVSTSDVPPQHPWSASSTMTLEQAREFGSSCRVTPVNCIGTRLQRTTRCRRECGRRSRR